jgi:hypothetical protein
MSEYLNDLLTDARGWATCEGCDDRAEFFAYELMTGLDGEMLTKLIADLFPAAPTVEAWRLELSVLAGSAIPLLREIARWVVEVIHTQYVNRDTRQPWIDWPTPDQRAQARAWSDLAARLVKGAL